VRTRAMRTVAGRGLACSQAWVRPCIIVRMGVSFTLPRHELCRTHARRTAAVEVQCIFVYW
jgi:hypothetical protein